MSRFTFIALIATFLALTASVAAASHALVVAPVTQQVSAGGTIDLGTVGPGQKLEIQVQRNAGEYGKADQEILWDQLVIDDTTLPAGWRAELSRIYENPFKAFVTLPADALDGDYHFDLVLVDEGEGLGTLRLSATAHVTRDVLQVKASPAVLRAGAGQPALVTLEVSNTGSASDAFEISAGGLPVQWRFRKNAFVPAHTTITVSYEVVAQDPGDYPLSITVQSLSSALITKTTTHTLAAETALWSDARATANGILLFPWAESATYSLIGLLANLIR